MKRYISFHNETVIKGMSNEKSHLSQHHQITNHIKKGCNINEDVDIIILKLHSLHKNGTPRLMMIPHQII
ncbi:uncharacterized protein METZ01_LOCUS357859 [marine metagenome]|uniref:Uncharacterized protein n=1 Tax=marine metagenome TaxID=408172 RepID=A0A382S6C2_9ZZZZ